MKDRLITLVFALAAFVLSLFLLIPPHPSEKELSLPTTEDKGSAGLKGLYQWLKSNDVAIYSLRKGFNTLNQPNSRPATGNILFLSLPQHTHALHDEWLDLHTWIKRGNTVFILAAGYFKPEWAQEKNSFYAINQLLKGFDLTLSKTKTEHDLNDKKINKSFKHYIDALKDNLASLLPEDITLHPDSKHPLTQQVSSVQSKITPSLLNNQWAIKANNTLALKLLSFPNTSNHPLLWQLEAGKGQLFLSLSPNIFSNELLNQADNAKLLANTLALSLGNNGQVIFDDYHFGLSHLYDANTFFSDTRLHQTLGFIAILWLLYVLGYTNRLAPVQKTRQKPAAVDFVKAMAGFFSHHLNQQTVAHTLTQRLIHDLRLRRQFANDTLTWQCLYQHPQLSKQQIDFLKQADQKHPVSLHKLTYIITEIRKTLFL